MAFRLRKRITVIPGVLYANASNSGVSWTLKLWRWSWNSRARRARVDLPGPVSWVGAGPGTARRRATRSSDR